MRVFLVDVVVLWCVFEFVEYGCYEVFVMLLVCYDDVVDVVEYEDGEFLG